MTFFDSLKTLFCPLWAWIAECRMERTGSEGLGSEGLGSERWGCRGCTACAGTGKDKPSSPLTITPRTYECKRNGIC